jgi:hypothetical protein
MADYFSHPDWKAANPQGIGQLERMHVRVLGLKFIGKETNEILEEIEEESGEVITYPDAQVFGETGIGRALADPSVYGLLETEGIPRETMRRLRHGANPSAMTRAKLERGRNKDA